LGVVFLLPKNNRKDKALPRLTPGSPESTQRAPVGPGVALIDVVDFTVDGILGSISGDESRGRSLGALTAAPSFSASPTFQDRTENLVGLNAPFKGAQQIVRTDTTVDVEIAELTNENYGVIHPGLTEQDFLNSMHGHLVSGTGNSKFAITARAAGTGGNSITLTLTAGTGNSTPTSVAVSTNAITVTLGTDSGGAVNATANEVIAAINASTAAKALVKAGRGVGSDGTGVVAAATSAPLAGGTLGTKTGTDLLPTGYISNGDYFDNLVMALEGPNQPVLQCYIAYNVISLSDISYQPDDTGNVASIAATFTAHVTAQQLNAPLGIYRPPYLVRNFDLAAVS
jgi:hypothetical protein